MKAWEFIIDTLDSQISVKDGLFMTDLRLLAPLPAIPFFLAALVIGTPSTAATVLLSLGVIVMVPWTILIFKRRRLKKQNFVSPTRYSDESNGY